MIKTNLKSSKLILFLVAAMFIALPVVVHAENRDTIKERQGERQQNRCENKKKVIDNRIKMFQVSEKFHKVKYSRIYDRLTSLIERLDAQGVDTSKLKSDLGVLKGKIDTLKTNYDTLMSKLEALKNVDCTNVQANKTALDEIRGLLSGLKSDSNDIREFFINTIKPDLKELKTEINAKKDSEESSENNTRTSETTEGEDN